LEKSDDQGQRKMLVEAIIEEVKDDRLSSGW
jgi:hypothetical protein